MIVTSSHTRLDLAALCTQVEYLRTHARRSERQPPASLENAQASWQQTAARQRWSSRLSRLPLIGRPLRQIFRRLRQIPADPAVRARIKTLPVLGKLAVLAHAVRQLPALRQAQTEDRLRIERLEAELQALNARIEAYQKTLNPLDHPDLFGGTAQTSLFYSAFSRHFRGTEVAVAESLMPYVARLAARLADRPEARVVDIGCGNGIWLRLLAEHGIAAFGFDLDGVAVQTARANGLDARLDDGIRWLRQQPSESLDVVTAFHLIEHLEPAILLDFFCTAARVLKPGGLLICETPNPENLLVGACTFYMDPTHRNPIPHTLAKFLAEFSGFPHVEILGLHPFPDTARLPADDPAAEKLNQILFGPQDYALIAQK